MRVWAAIALPILSASDVDAEGYELTRRAISVQGGVMTDDEWTGILGSPGSIDFRSSWSFGVGGNFEWSLGGLGTIGVELTVLKHQGDQDHWEVSGPIYLRSNPWPSEDGGVNLAYGLGLSYATEVPDVEVDRKGGSDNLMAYWFIEFEYAQDGLQTHPFIRLHHRSDAFGVFQPDTGSNMIMLGLRQDF